MSNLRRRQVTIVHVGNTANNAVYHAKILSKFSSIYRSHHIHSEVVHSLSFPSWEFFESRPACDGQGLPTWRYFVSIKYIFDCYHIPNFRLLIFFAVGFYVLHLSRKVRTALGRTTSRVITALRRTTSRVITALRRPTSRVITALRRPTSRVITALRRPTSRVITALRRTKRRSSEARSVPGIQIIYGPSIPPKRGTQPGNTILFEHGTLRWSRNFLPEHQSAATEYRLKIERADLLLVTNLDEETLVIAQGLSSTPWIAFPHPYDFNPRAPYPRATALREEILNATKSRYLILSPASINWRSDHNKGTDVGLRAFAELRRQGLQVGLVLAEWGRDVERAREYLHLNGLERHVHFTPLLSRFGLQKMMAACDVVWDQFGLDAFGALALRAMEQRVPLVSKAIGPKAEQLIGKSPPYVNADDPGSLALATEALVFASASELRDRVEAQHSWLTKKHHPAITAELAKRSFDYVLDEGPQPQSGEWSRLEYNPGSGRVEEVR